MRNLVFIFWFVYDKFQAEVNECFLILIEIVELICKAGGEYSTEVAVEYHIDQIIDELTEFLRFIREMTSNYKHNGHKINRNNSISILFLLCRLVMFRDNAKGAEDETIQAQLSSRPNESFFDSGIEQRLKRLTLNSSRQSIEPVKNDVSSSNTIDDITSVSTMDNYVTATEYLATAAGNGAWRKELQIALLDYPLKHFYPQVVDLISYAMKVLCADIPKFQTKENENFKPASLQIDVLPENNPLKVLMKLPELLEPVVTLLRDPQMCTHKQVIAYGIESIDVLTVVKSDDLTHLMFNAIIK